MMIPGSSRLVCLLLFLLLAPNAWSQSSVQGQRDKRHQPPHKFQPFTKEQWQSSSMARPEDLQWFRQARFGLFIHFGVSSVRGAEIGWGRETRIAPDRRKGPVPDEVYDHLYEQLDLKHFDASRWVKMAQDAGMKYIVVITKHHDGFHMWDTAFSDYKITKTPFGRDYLKEIVDACHKAQMPVGLYYSQRDWYHGQYDPRGRQPDRDHRKYVEYMHNTVHELLTKYGKIDILWFDAHWWGGMFEEKDWDSERLYRMARKLQPGILINNRSLIPGDFDTPEQRVGRFQNDRPWESCITIGRSWAWHPNDRTKSLKQCLSTLVRTAAGDGNLLLNLGPKADGTFNPEQVDRIRAMGQWLDKYGESIYGTRGGPLLPSRWGGSTHKGNQVFVHVLDWQGKDHLSLPGIPRRVVSSRLMTANGKPTVTQTERAVKISLPKEHHDPIDTIIVLEMDRPVIDGDIVTLTGVIPKLVPVSCIIPW